MMKDFKLLSIPVLYLFEQIFNLNIIFRPYKIPVHGEPLCLVTLMMEDFKLF